MTYNELLTEWTPYLPPKREFQIAEQIVLFSESSQRLSLSEQNIVSKAKEFLLTCNNV